MNAQEIIAKVSKYKEMLEAESDSDIRARYLKKIKELEASLVEVEKKVEKLEEKVATEEKKELSEAEKKIRKYQDFLDNESDPDLKARYQKKIKELQDSLKEVKEEIKVEKKEVAEQKAEIKKAVKVVKAAKATKVERKEAVKKVEKKVRERKEVSVKRTRRGKKIKEIIGELDKLIAKNKKLKEKYTGKGVDVKRDAGRSAKPFGYRFVGKHDYRVPTAEQIKKGKKRGTIDYEGRPNRSDVYPKRAAKLADGGMMAKGEESILVYYVNHYPEDELGLEIKAKATFKGLNEVLDNKKDVYSYIGVEDSLVRERVFIRLAQINRVDYDVIYKKWLEADEYAKGGYMAKGGKTQGYDDREDERLGMEDGKLSTKDFIGSRKHRKHSRRDDAQFEERGKMAKGAEVGQMSVAKSNWNKFNKKQRIDFLVGAGYSKSEANDLSVKKWDSLGEEAHNDLRAVLLADGGMMAKGGRVGHSKEDKARFAKPAGWRWKEIAVTKRIIERKQLSMQPSKKMRDKYPDYVYYEDRLNKADKKPSRKYLSE
jgi:hypothetical protein